MKKFVISAVLVFSYLATFSQNFSQIGVFSPTKLPANPSNQEEYAFDKPSNPAKWDSLKPGLHTAFVDASEVVFRSEVPQREYVTLAEESAWKGERLNVQIIVWAADTIENIRLTFHDLEGEPRMKFSKNNFKVHKVNYVVSNYPYGASDVDCGGTPYKDVYLMPDRFSDFDPNKEVYTLPGRTVRSFWVTIDIPEDQETGGYGGVVEVTAPGFSRTLDFQFFVQDYVMPRPKDWNFRLDLWQNPWVVAWQRNIKPWSDEHKKLLKQHLQLYADAGGKYITTYAVHSPWSDNSYWIEGGMIDWIKTKRGKWKFDYTIFDQYIQTAMEVGIDEAITIYTPVPWGNRFQYKNLRTDSLVYESWAPDSKEFRKYWRVFLSNLRLHLKKKGWLDKTYLGINENELQQTLTAIKVIKRHSKKWRITYAGDWHPELDKLLDDYSFLYGKEPSIEQQQARAARGASSTYYVCCTPAKPNTFVFSPPIEARYIGWYSLAYGYDGFLRWAYDAWPADPMRDARHGSWAAGDCYLIYPGAQSCIRFERLREGISDVEKIGILRQKAAQSASPEVKALMQKLDALIAEMATDHNFGEEHLHYRVDQGRVLINDLSEALAVVKSR